MPQDRVWQPPTAKTPESLITVDLVATMIVALLAALAGACGGVRAGGRSRLTAEKPPAADRAR
ncbi:hypothetical protein [Micromonospora sp. NPDC003776]